MRRVRAAIVVVEKAMNITQPGCVYLSRNLSSMQCACAILSSVACLALKYLSTLAHKFQDFRKKDYWTHSTTFV
jgi:hypothetical protein